MIICKTNSEKNIEFAKKYGVWQTRKKYEVKEGEVFALQLTKTDYVRVVGIISSETTEDEAPKAWPGGEQNFRYTFKFSPIQKKLKGQQTFRRIKSVNNEQKISK